MKYAVDYRLLPNLRVGLNSYLYRPAEDGFTFQRPMGNQLLGVGPELKYDLGRWSFLLKSQMETGNRDGRAKTCKTGSGSGTPSNGGFPNPLPS